MKGIKRLNRYERILARKDKKRPDFVTEIQGNRLYPRNAMVLKMKMLTPKGSIIEISWSEKLANQI